MLSEEEKKAIEILQKNNEFCEEKCIDKNIEYYDCIKQYFKEIRERKSEEC